MEPINTAKLIGSLYEKKRPKVEQIDPQIEEEKRQNRFVADLFNEHERTARKASRSSSRASETQRAMREVIDDCNKVQKEFNDTMTSINNTARDKFLDHLGTKKYHIAVKLPMNQWLEDEQDEERRARIIAIDNKRKQFSR